MNKQFSDLKPEAEVAYPLEGGLALLRRPFPDHQISKLPKPTKAQTDAVKADFKKGIRCKICSSWHHPEVVHLDYVGHAALTDRLLDADPEWSWEPASFRDGLPAFDQSGGLWIKLTVCGVTRLGYGHAAAKPGQDPGAREKEVIGDALRNAAMRFGAALDLWHKGDLHVADDEPTQQQSAAPKAEEKAEPTVSWKTLDDEMDACRSVEELEAWNNRRAKDIKALPKPRYDALGLKFGDLRQTLPDTTSAAPLAPADEFGLGGDNLPEFH